MKSDTTLRVFDGDGQYLSSALAADSVIAEPPQCSAGRTVSVVEYGMAPREEVIREVVTIDAEQLFPNLSQVAKQLTTQPAPAFATLDEVETMLSAHPAGLSKEFAQWLVRVCRASDARIVELENQVKQHQRDFNGLVSEWQDLADENRKLKQQAEVDRVVCDSQERTILELQARVKELESALGTQLNELLAIDQSGVNR